MIEPMSPTCFAQSDTNAFSVLVLVSDGELANIASIFAAISGARSGSAIVNTYQLYLIAEAAAFADGLAAGTGS